MLKIFLFCIGIVLIFEGLIYFLLANKIKSMIKILESLKSEKIRFLSSLLIIMGLLIIYCTAKIYEK